MAGLMMREILFKFQCITNCVYLVPENITDGQREDWLRVIGGVVEQKYLLGYRMQRNKSLHISFASLFTDISPILSGFADMVRIEFVNTHIGESRITIDGKLAQFSIKIEINPDLWSVTLGRASDFGRESQQANVLLDDIKASLHRIYHEMQRIDSVVTAEKVKNEFLGITEHHDNLLDLFRKHNEDVQKLVGISKSSPKEVDSSAPLTVRQQFRNSSIFIKMVLHRFYINAFVRYSFASQPYPKPGSCFKD